MSPLSATLLRSSKQKASAPQLPPADAAPPAPLEPSPPPSAPPVYGVSLHEMTTVEAKTQPPPPPPPPAEPHGLSVSYLKHALDLMLGRTDASASDLAEMYCIAYADLQRRVHQTLLPEPRLLVDNKLELDLRKVEIPDVSPVECPFADEDLREMVSDFNDERNHPQQQPLSAFHLPPSDALLEMLCTLGVGGESALRSELADRLRDHVNDVFFGALRHHLPIESEQHFRVFFPNAAELPGGACCVCKAPRSVFHARIGAACPSLVASGRLLCHCPPRHCVGCDVEFVVAALNERLLRAPSEAWDCVLRCNDCQGSYCPFSAFNTQAVVATAEGNNSSHDEIATLQEGVVEAVAPPVAPVCTCYGTLAPYRLGTLGDIGEAAAANFGVMRVQPQNVAPGARQVHARNCPLSTSHQRPRQQQAIHNNRGTTQQQPPRRVGRPTGSTTKNKKSTHIKTEHP